MKIVERAIEFAPAIIKGRKYSYMVKLSTGKVMKCLNEEVGSYWQDAETGEMVDGWKEV